MIQSHPDEWKNALTRWQRERLAVIRTLYAQQREMYEMKKLLSVPMQQLLLTPYYLARDFNEWDPHMEWEIGQMTLTTLDRNKNGMEETKV
mgnify:CR=1 FL=1